MRPRRKGTRRDDPWVLYPRGEDIFYMILHIVSAVLAAGMLTVCVVYAALNYHSMSVLSAAIYGSSMLIFHILLSIYHGLPYGIGKDVLYVVARGFLYIFFVGTFMAVSFIGSADNQWSQIWYLFGGTLVIAVIGIVFQSISMERFSKLVLVCYAIVLWMNIVPILLGYQTICTDGMPLLIAGNGAYMICGICRLQGDEITWARILKKITLYIGLFSHFFCILFYTITV